MPAIVGPPVERRLGRVRWLFLYLAGGLAGQATGVSWEPRGAWNSVAIPGLIGGWFVLQAKAVGLDHP